MKKSNQKGFTLVELMVVVAIIGILSAIAIPNFNRYQRNAKKPEGKLALSEVYTAQVVYYGEQTAYTDQISLLGITKQRNNYTFGFTGAETTNFIVGANNPAEIPGADLPSAFAAATPQTYTAAAIGAIGSLDGSNPLAIHSYTVDQAQNFVEPTP